MKESAIARPVTRRRLLATGVAGGVGLFVGCGSGARSDTGWTFVDDRRRTIRLKKRPTRIVAYTSAAAALHDWGVTPVGVFGDDPREDPSSDARTPDGAGFQRSGAWGGLEPPTERGSNGVELGGLEPPTSWVRSRLRLA
jgi:hypothetical protein